MYIILQNIESISNARSFSLGNLSLLSNFEKLFWNLLVERKMPPQARSWITLYQSIKAVTCQTSLCSELYHTIWNAMFFPSGVLWKPSKADDSSQTVWQKQKIGKNVFEKLIFKKVLTCISKFKWANKVLKFIKETNLMFHIIYRTIFWCWPHI